MTSASAANRARHARGAEEWRRRKREDDPLCGARQPHPEDKAPAAMAVLEAEDFVPNADAPQEDAAGAGRGAAADDEAAVYEASAADSKSWRERQNVGRGEVAAGYGRRWDASAKVSSGESAAADRRGARSSRRVGARLRRGRCGRGRPVVQPSARRIE